MTRRLAVIPARGGSKRIPRKNVRLFRGRPMIAHSLDAVLESGLFDEIHVSTDCPEVQQVAAAMGLAPAFGRPAYLADDHTPLMPVLKYVLEEYQRKGTHFDQVAMVMACAPLVSAQDLRDACALFEAHGGRYNVMAVAPYAAPIEWAYGRDSSGVLTPLTPGAFATRSQDLETRYYDAGAFYVYSSEFLLRAEGAGSDAGYLGQVLPKHRVVDIDTEEDWALAEKLAADS